MTLPDLHRRRALGGLLALGELAAAAPLSLGRTAPAGALRVTLSGQLLITHDICAAGYAGFEDVARELRRGDVVFSDLETAIRTSASGEPTRDDEFLHVAEPRVLGCVRSLGFNLLALANNHAWDLGTAGVLATREAVAAAGFAHAGTGATLAQATRAGSLCVSGRRVSLVAMACGKIRAGAAATPTRPGVNEVKLHADGRLDRQDVERNLAAVGAAAAAGDVVIAYLHNHEWGEDMALTQPWARELARACVDAGARLFVSHGAPLLHGIEWHRGAPLFHGLGSLVFHSRTPPGHYRPEVWESAIVHCELSDAGAALEIVPVVLNEIGDDPARQY